MLRDAVMVAATLACWRAALAQPDSVVLAIVTALLTVAGGYLAHEWGHFAGALLMRCALVLPRTPFESPFLFRFDRERNTRRQFFGMALGGFAASILTAVVLPIVLPWELLATRIALALVALGVVATLVIEVPEFRRVWRGGPIPAGVAFVGGRKA